MESSRCPALRAAAEQQGLYSPNAPGPAGGPLHYDPVHHNSPHRNLWHPHSPRYWRQPVMPPPAGFSQDPFQPNLHPGQNSSIPPSFALMGMDSYLHTHPTPSFLPPIPRLSTLPPFQNSAGSFVGPTQARQTGTGTDTSMGTGAQPTHPPQHHQGSENIPPGNAMPHLATPPVVQNATTSTGNAGPERAANTFTSPPHGSRDSPLPASRVQPTGQTSTDQTRVLPVPYDTRRALAAHPRSRQNLPTYIPVATGWSSDEDSDSGDPELGAFLDSVAAGGSATEERLRAQQILRGAVTGRRIASKKAIASLQSVDVSELPESERTCVICYNDFGVANPEGINEAPLRLPKCKHVFGDHCIKKWFEDSDSCPYCRDKVPSEPQFRHGSPQGVYRFLRQHHLQFQAMQHIRQQVAPRDRERHDSDLPRLSSPMFDAMSGTSLGPSSLADYAAAGSVEQMSRRSEAYFSTASTTRTPTWRAGRRSPPNDNNDNRRRTRARHSGLPGSPPAFRSNVHGANASTSVPQIPGRPTRRPRSRSPIYGSGFGPQLGAQQPLTNSQASRYSWISDPHAPVHGQRNYGNAAVPNSGPGLDVTAPPFVFPSPFGSSHEHYLNPLQASGPSTTQEEYPSALSQLRSPYVSPLSPTIGGPEVYMASAEDDAYGHPSHQQM
ncbi:hypothetical protein F4780DRAFT_366758 [Xylariomycetidae sp. FL0641]|nr:hypothetical protein F4780DRAFT_366758 [Xylariomycetidae sp. FL0641]